ncbi:UDP:flavonoid glycosyltransferase YjiC, YdhE family [Abditibacterium utsteinense]|uniref:UDP:flavonoid glycosyltransferase YjiC, YdhE family n=1 Tax=Abditibacterium utsteinense TaxID=1960156 RepID=A0A2S8SVQ7_9BACT|nr:nucleotide disphospho-sugar-binding domain-containing protein [Abditibacterium utsteinense]PQV64875.1 UDP:flavonoid glycosyltransferase YjiC, YdhE family [Abditibacterium utsteinense]
MNILFSTFGSLGDLHPYLAVALEAKARGHRPVFATAPKYQAKIEALGLEFRAVRPDLPAENDFSDLARRVMDLKDGPRYLFEEIINPNLRNSYADLLAASEDADVLITHPAVISGPLVAQKMKKKWLSSALAPISLWSKLDPPTPPTVPHLDFLRALGPIWPTIMFTLGRAGTRNWVSNVEKLRDEIGVSSLGHPMFEGQFSPFGTLALFSPLFAPPQRDWPRKTTAAGFCFYDASGISTKNEADSSIVETNSTTVEANWRDWISRGKAPIVFTLGSSAVHDAGDFWTESARVTKNEGARAIFLTARTYQSDSDEILALDYAPHSEIFPLARLIVHQGGAGTTAQALRAGKPQIVTPYAHDQPDNARRLRKLGIALSILQGQFKGKAADEIVSRALNLDAACAKEIGEKMKLENGPRAACEMIESI